MYIDKEKKGDILLREKELIERELPQCTDHVRIRVLVARLKNLDKKLAERLEQNSRDVI